MFIKLFLNFRTDWPGLLSNHGFLLENNTFNNEENIKKNRKGEYSYTVTPPRFGRNPCTISGRANSAEDLSKNFTSDLKYYFKFYLC